MTAHTPGPWKYDHKSGWIDSAGCCERGPMHVADIRGWGHLTGKGHGAHAMDPKEAMAIQAANGALVAAAPELLECLLFVCDYVKNGEQTDGAVDAWVDRATAAIAKATSRDM